MCQDDNSAPLSARYLKSQLTTLWQNAVQCVQESGDNGLDVTSHEYEKNKYTHALAQHQHFGPKAPTTIRSTGDFFFYAKFGEPDLQFICNHEAVLTLTVEKANLNLDFGKSSITGAYVDQQMNATVQNIQVAYRLPFNRHDVKSTDSVLNVKPFSNLVRLVVFDVGAAKLVKIKSDVSLSADLQKALKFYLDRYLGFLHQGGIDILYDLPHTDDVRIDYALQRPVLDIAEWFSGLKVHSVENRLINEYLYWKWQTAIRLGRPADHLSTCLAEISSAWVHNLSINNHFFARFGAPEIKAFCPHEVLLLFHVEDIAWFSSSNFEIAKADIYHNWTIAFLVEAVEEKEGSVTRIKLNFETARFSPYHSKCADTDPLAVNYFNLFIRFILVNYLPILIQYLHHIVYVSGGIKEFVPSIELSYKPGVAPTDEQIIAWTKQIQHLTFYGFDEITALSEEGINLLYSSLWNTASRSQNDNLLASLTLDRFKANFSAPTIRLMSNGKAMVWITVKRGEIVVVRENQRRDFWTWPLAAIPLTGDVVEQYVFNDTSSLAFEVDLKLTDHELISVSDAWRQKFYTSDLWSQFKTKQDAHVFKHLFLDFHNATYVPELSTVNGFGKGRESLTRLATLVNHTKDYLSRLADDGYHVLYSLPVWTQRGVDPSHAYTDIKHQVTARSSVTVSNCGISRTVYESPIILLLGMYGFRQVPHTTIPWHDLWVIYSRKYKTIGSVYLSKDAFLETRLLPLIERINRKTTVIPKAAGIINGKWSFDITTWAQDAYRSKLACPWKPITAHIDNTSLQYVWEHRSELSQKETSSGPSDRTAESTVSCETHNTITIPTTYHPDSLEISLKGESKLKVVGENDGRRWSKSASAAWHSPVRILPGINHLNVELPESIKPILSQVYTEGQSVVDLESLFAKQLPGSIDVRDILTGLKQAWETQREFLAAGMQRCLVTSPVVTPTSGLILQLCAETGVEAAISKGHSTISVYENGRAVSDVAYSISTAPNGITVSETTTVVTPTPSVSKEIYLNGSPFVDVGDAIVTKKIVPPLPYFWQPKTRP